MHELPKERPASELGGDEIKDAAEKFMAFQRLGNHMFVEMPVPPSPDAKSFRFLRLSEPRIQGDL